MKIAICVPVHGDTKARFTTSLARLLITTLDARISYGGGIVRPKLEIFSCSSSRIAESRQQLADDAVQWGADFILWADADHSFPSDALLRLLAASRDVVGVNYLTRDGSRPTAIDKQAGPVCTTASKARAKSIEEVGSLGLGLCLVRTRVLQDLPRPWFAYEVRQDGSTLSEDAYFFWKLRTSGAPIYVDHALSWEVGHIGERVLMNADLGGEDARSVLSASGP